MIKHVIFALLLSTGNAHGLLRVVAGSIRSAATAQARSPKPQCGKNLIPECLRVIRDLDSKQSVSVERLRDIFERAQRVKGCPECPKVSHLVEKIWDRLRIAREPDL